MKIINIFLLILISNIASANTRLAFLESHDFKGQLIQYEPTSRFGHSAIEIDGLWLQSYPPELDQAAGVQLITLDELKKRGTIVKIISIPQTVTRAQIQGYLNKPFDFQYSWGDDAYYCAELLAKILQIPPEPMKLNHLIWPPSYWSGTTSIEGQPGISPDKIYRHFTGLDPWAN